MPVGVHQEEKEDPKKKRFLKRLPTLSKCILDVLNLFVALLSILGLARDE